MGQYLSALLRPGMKVGVGWGKTLIAALAYIDEKPLPGLAVVSLLGGIAKVGHIIIPSISPGSSPACCRRIAS